MVCIFNHFPRLTWSTFDETTLLDRTSHFVCVCLFMQTHEHGWILHIVPAHIHGKKHLPSNRSLTGGVKTFLRKLTNRWSLVMIIILKLVQMIKSIFLFRLHGNVRSLDDHRVSIRGASDAMKSAMDEKKDSHPTE